MRYTRHDLKQDKFKSTTAEAVHWTVEHQGNFVIGGIILAVVVILGAGGWWYFSYRASTAQTELGDAMVTYAAPVVPPGIDIPPTMTTFTSDQQRLITAKNAFYAISSKYGNTTPGKYAHYFAALCEVDLGNNAVAIDQLKSVAASGNKDVAALANFALASVYRNQGQEGDATKIYQDLIAKPTATVPKATAQLELADLLTATRPAEALRLYQQISKDDPKSAAADIAGQKIASLQQPSPAK